MASRQQIKRRITSVKNTKQITKAMELVAASRMRRAQDMVGGARHFGDLARELLTNLRIQVRVESFPLYASRPITARLLIVLSSDRGLAGAYNANVLKKYVTELRHDEKNNVKSYAICIGRQAATFSGKLRQVEVVGAYQDLPDRPTSEEILPIVSTAVKLFSEKTIDAVDVIYTHYHSSIHQEPAMIHLLPAGFEDKKPEVALRTAEFEPSAEAVLEATTTRLLEMQLLRSLYESIASEHSMRMMAMKNATDNATDIADDLTLAYNNARQAAITQELAEITGGAEALNA